MKRIRLYLDKDVWKVLQILSRQSGASISDLVRQAVRERYLGGNANRQQVLMSVVGLWRNRRDLPDTDSYVRALRQGKRLERVQR